MKHKGKIVEKAVRESGISITKICKKLGKTTRWMYYTFENPDVSLDYIIKIGKIIHHDFSSEIKEYSSFMEKSLRYTIYEPEASYIDRLENADYWKDKYLELLEKYNALLAEKLENKKK